MTASGSPTTARRLDGGVIAYTPAANYAGPDSFTYTLSDGNGGTATCTVDVTVTPLNDNPIAVNDTVSIVEDSLGSIVNVLGNDVDVDTGATLTVALGLEPVARDVTLNADGTFTYTPARTSTAPTPSPTRRATAARSRTSRR